jgi:hypothetical protein
MHNEMNAPPITLEARSVPDSPVFTLVLGINGGPYQLTLRDATTATAA